AYRAIYTLSLHDALPIFRAGGKARHHGGRVPLMISHLDGPLEAVQQDFNQTLVIGDPLARPQGRGDTGLAAARTAVAGGTGGLRSEEHTSELQSREKLVC